MQLVDIKDESGSYLYSRPVCGKIIINTETNDDFETWGEFDVEERRRTIFHELTHAMAFNPAIIPFYIDNKGAKIKKEEVLNSVSIGNHGSLPHLIHPKMKKAVEDYFNCPADKNNGFPLEAKDSAHFHQQIIANQIMRPMADNFVDGISKFMTTLYKLTGWYEVNDSSIEKTIWGEKQGCSFLELKCKDEKDKLFTEYCEQTTTGSMNYQGCDYYYKNAAACSVPRGLTDLTCPIMVPLKKNCLYSYTNKTSVVDEVLGKDSKCVEFYAINSKQNKVRWGGCYESSCDEGNKTITLKVSGETLVIKYDENFKPDKESNSVKVGAAKNFSIEIQSPDFKRFCFKSKTQEQEQNKQFKKK